MTSQNDSSAATFQLGDIGQTEPRHTHRDLPSRITRKNKEFLSVTDLKKGAFWKTVKDAWGRVYIADSAGRKQPAHAFSFFTVSGVKLINANAEAFLRNYALSINKSDDGVPRLLPKFAGMLRQKNYLIKAKKERKLSKSISAGTKNGWVDRKKRMQELGGQGREYPESYKKDLVAKFLAMKEANQIRSIEAFAKEVGGPNANSLRKWLRDLDPSPKNGSPKPSKRKETPKHSFDEANLVESAKSLAREQFEKERDAFLVIVEQEKAKLWEEFRKEK